MSIIDKFIWGIVCLLNCVIVGAWVTACVLILTKA